VRGGALSGPPAGELDPGRTAGTSVGELRLGRRGRARPRPRRGHERAGALAVAGTARARWSSRGRPSSCDRWSSR
jgi:hypothetical protein